MCGSARRQQPGFRGSFAGHVAGGLALVLVIAFFLPLWAFALGDALGTAVTNEWPLLAKWGGAGAIFGKITSVLGLLAGILALVAPLDLRYKAAVVVILVAGVCATVYTATALEGFW